jgi:hypothetical protein
VSTSTFRTENPELTPCQPSFKRPRSGMLSPVRVVVVESDAHELSDEYNTAGLAAIRSQKVGEQWSLERAEKDRADVSAD